MSKADLREELAREHERHPANRLANVRRRVNRARRFPHNTCPASRHVHIMADCLSTYGEYAMAEEEPLHVAGSLYGVIESLWKMRTENDELRRRLGIPPRHIARRIATTPDRKGEG